MVIGQSILCGLETLAQRKAELEVSEMRMVRLSVGWRRFRGTAQGKPEGSAWGALDMSCRRVFSTR